MHWIDVELQSPARLASVALASRKGSSYFPGNLVVHATGRGSPKAPVIPRANGAWDGRAVLVCCVNVPRLDGRSAEMDRLASEQRPVMIGAWRSVWGAPRSLTTTRVIVMADSSVSHHGSSVLWV